MHVVGRGDSGGRRTQNEQTSWYLFGSEARGLECTSDLGVVILPALLHVLQTFGRGGGYDGPELTKMMARPLHSPRHRHGAYSYLRFDRPFPIGYGPNLLFSF